MTPIERRIARLEAATLPKPPKDIRLLCEPQDGATDEDRERYACELARAEAEADMTIIITALRPLPLNEGNRVYAKDKTSAHFKAAMHMPSKRGNSCLLADIVQDAAKAGNVLRPVAQPAG
jgi:hypothetical protein